MNTSLEFRDWSQPAAKTDEVNNNIISSFGKRNLDDLIMMETRRPSSSVSITRSSQSGGKIDSFSCPTGRDVSSGKTSSYFEKCSDFNSCKNVSVDNCLSKLPDLSPVSCDSSTEADNSYSSLESLTLQSLHESKVSSPPKPKRSVQFHEDVYIREYEVTATEHSMCTDGLGMSLDWAHAEEYTLPFEYIAKERGRWYCPPARLSFSERRRRLQKVSPTNYKEWRDESILGGNKKSAPGVVPLVQTGAADISSVISRLQQSWQAPKFLPDPKFSKSKPVATETMESKEKLPSKHYFEVMTWERVR